MKKHIFILALLLSAAAGSLQATDITFDGKQKLYFNASTSWISFWNTSGAVFSAYFFKGSDPGVFADKAEQIDGNVYAVTVPAGTWSHVILTRHEPSTTIFDFDGGHGFWNQSRDISLNQYQWDNYISEFNLAGDGTDPYCVWNQLYSEQPKNGTSPADVAAYWGLTIENIPVCSNSTGDPFTLTPNTRETGGGKYEYNFEMRAHAWFKTTDNGATWTNVDGKAGIRASADEGEINFNNELVGPSGSHTYYYLYAKEADDQRLIHVSVDKDCEVTCEITSFEMTPTAVNVGTNTYTMDGIVAFTKAMGSLIIECDGKTTVIAAPVSPQTFSLPGLDADGAAETFHAYFSGMGSCERYKNTTAPTPASDAITHPDKNIAPLDNITLTPDADGTDDWEWTQGSTFVKVSPALNNKYDVPTLDHDGVVTYVYTEYNPTPTLPTNLMDNGSFEDVSIPFKWETAYKNSNVLNGNQIWDGGVGRKDIYDLPAFIGTYGYFGVTTNANTYWKLMSHVSPKDGTYLAVIDGDEVADKQAWHASTGALNPNLLLMRGTTYLFSFWVANINNFGELINNGRKNCAILQFHIRCHSADDGLWYEEDLGTPIDLNDDKYMDFNWHQNSSTFSTREYFNKDFNADYVTISVVDKNNTGLTIGNDFALDDIQFRAVSILSKSIKAREFFKVKFYEPPTVVNKPVITITQTPACGKTDFTMQVDVSYSTLNNKFPITLQLTDDVYGPIFSTPITIDPAVNPNNITLTLPTSIYPMLVADGAVHNLTAKITRLDGALVDKGGENSNNYTSPGIPAINMPVLTEQNKSCDKTTYDLQVATTYTAFKGTQLHYDWDGAEWTNVDANPLLSYKEATPQTAIAVLQNLPADDQNHVLRVYSDNTALDCEYTFTALKAPYSPKVTVEEPEIQTYACGDGTYKVKVSATFTNGQLHNIIFKDWNGGTEVSKATTTNNGTAEHTFTYTWDAAPTSHTYDVYFAGATGCHHYKSYTSHAEPKLTVTPSVINTSCDKTTYSLRLDLSYTNQRGNNILANVDGGTNVTKANSHKSQMSSATDFIQIDNLPADGATHQYNLWFDNTKDCSKLNINFDAPYSPKISSTVSAVQPYSCGDPNYQVKVTVNYENSQNHDLIITDESGLPGHEKTLKSTDAEYAVSPGQAEWIFVMPWEFPVAAHTFKAYFAGAAACKDEDSNKGTYTSPAEPKINNIKYNIPAVTACDVTTYDMTVTFDYYNQDGTLSVDIDGTPALSIAPAFVKNSPTKQSATATFTGLSADGADKTITVKTTGGSHNCSETKPLTGVPHLPIINSVAQAFTPDYVCGDAQYHVTLTVNYTNALSKKIYVKEGSTVIASKTANAGAGTFSDDIQLDFDFNTNHNLKVYFDGREDCAQDITVTSPAQPKLTVTHKPVNTDCNKTDYDYEVTLTYTNQDGTLSIDVDGVAATSYTPAFVPSSATEQTLKALVKNLPADGAATHVLNITFTGGAHSCVVAPITFTAPYSPKISSTVATVQPYSCGDPNYQVKVTVNYENSQNHDLIITDESGLPGHEKTLKSTDAEYAVSPDQAEWIFVMPWESPVADHTFKAYFAGAASCKDEDSNKGTYTSPAEPKIDNIKYNILAVTACNVTTYDMTVTFDYYNQDGTLSVDIDGTPASSIAPAFVKNSPTKQSATATFTGLSADGADKTITVKTTGGSHNCLATLPLTGVPHLPIINSVAQAFTPNYVCGDAQYHVTLTVNYTNALSKKIYVKEGSTVIASKTANAGAGTFSDDIQLDFDFNTNHNLKVYFDGREDCAQSLTVNSPAQPKLTVTHKPVNTDCSKADYDYEVTLTYTNQDGTLSVDVDGVAATSYTPAFVPSSATEQTLKALVKNLPADGAATHVLNVTFTGGAHSCVVAPITFTAPYSPVINTVATPAQTYGCGDAQYHAVVRVNYTNALGKKINIKEGATILKSITAASDNGTHFEDIPLDIDFSSTHNLKVYFDGKEDCAKNITLSAPAKPTIKSINPSIISTACNTTTYDLQVEIKYVNQDATALSVDVDGVYTADPATLVFVANSATEQTLNAVVKNLPADGGTAHVLNVAFTGGSHSCPALPITLTGIPYSPAISSVTYDYLPDYKCGDPQYNVTLTVNYENGLGKKIHVKEGSAVLTSVTAINDAAAHTATIPLSFNLSSGTHNLKVYFDGKEDCGKTISIASPAQPALSATATLPTADCSTTSVAPVVTVSYTNQNGKPIVKWQHQTGQLSIPTTAYTVNSNSALTMTDLTMPALDPDGKTYTIEVSFSGSHGCNTTVPVTMPFVPQITSVSSPDPTVAFGETKYDVTVTVKFSNGQGKNLTIRSTDMTPVLTHTEAAPASGVLAHTFTGIETDNGIDHHFEVFFPDASVDCKQTTAFKSPIAKNFKSLTATKTDINCNTEFEISLSGVFAALSGNLVVNDLTLGEEIYNKPAPSGTTFDIKCKALKADGLTHNLEAYFTSDPANKKTVSIDAPKMPSLTVAHSFGAVDCNGNVTAHINVDFTNQTGDLVLLDENNNMLKTFTAPTEGVTCKYDWDMKADGAAHAVSAYFTSLGAACATNLPLTAPLTPTITVTKDAAASTLSCDGTFSYVYDITGTNQTGNLMVQGAGDLTPKNYGAVATAKHTVNSVQLTAGNVNVISVWYDNRSTCVVTETETFPDAVSIAMTNAVGALKCDGTFDAALTVVFSGQRGDLVIEDGAGNEIDRQTTVTSPYTFNWTNLTAKGQTYNAKAYFSLAPACDATTAFTAPTEMYIRDLKTSETVIYCNGTTYDLTINVEAENPQHDIIVKDGATEIHRFSVPMALAGVHTYSTTLTSLTTDEAAHNLKAYFDGYEACAKPWTYTAPTPHACIHKYDSICVGSGYNGYGIVLPAQAVAGDQQHQMVDTILHLHVMDLPVVSLTAIDAVCNSDGAAVIPYTIVGGEPNRYSVDFDDPSLPDLPGAVLKGTAINVPLPATTPAGIYTASYEFYASGAYCPTIVRFSFEVSEDGLIYSKWTDVLLINNVTDRFTGYQWYNNGTKMDGETQQRLYDPNGLNGNYYCVLTTTDGKTVKTCPVKFDDAPRSADLPQPTKISPQILRPGELITVDRAHDTEASIVFYSASGQRVLVSTLHEAREQVAAPAESGIYVVVIDDDMGRFTDKVVVE